ncbi:MAG: DUF3592 domain-containing protein [Bacteroidales bacterium]|nr:DUF3592 domain-containing protein [Bacteroidales bacterium]
MFIPLRIRLLHNFGRSSFNIGFLFTVIGLAFVIYFSFELNWKILLAGKNDLTPAVAYITDYHETQYSINDQFLFEYHYKYSVDSKNSGSGSFLEYPECYETGQEIQIEYLKNSPGVSRISGKDRSNFDQIMFLAGVVGLLAGFFFLYPSCRKTRRERKILMAGMPASGKLIHAEPTNLKVNDQTVYKLIYEYSTGNNKSQKFSVRSHMIRNLSDEHSEKLIYDPRIPSRAVIIDTLPASVARYVNSKFYPA